MLPDNILFSHNPAADIADFLRKKNYSQVVFLTDENTRKHCLPLLGAVSGPIIEVESGEENKTLRTCESIWEQMTQLNLDRHALMIVLGGGVLGDMGGFCAGTYKRGIDFVLVPTTLLAQVDASIGGKLGIDFNAFKNHIGIFLEPALTLLHSGFLKTLPHAELRSGFAEVIKHCLISDAKMWKEVSNLGVDQQDWDKLIRHSVAFKADVTTKDPKERGHRKILNAGHTIGHAVESHLLGEGKKILHGEAIAIGLIAEGFLSHERNLLTREELREIYGFILKIFGKVELTAEDMSGAAKLVAQDKKNRDNKILCVLLDGIGKCRWDLEITKDDVRRALAFYQSLQM